MHEQTHHREDHEKGELPGFQPTARCPHRERRAGAYQPQRHPRHPAPVSQVRGMDHPPQHDGQRRPGAGHRQPRRRLLRAHAEEAPRHRQLQHPQEVGIPLDVLARVEHQTVPFQQVAHVAEADEGVVGQEPGEAGEPDQHPHPRHAAQDEDHRKAPQPALPAGGPVRRRAHAIKPPRRRSSHEAWPRRSPHGPSPGSDTRSSGTTRATAPGSSAPIRSCGGLPGTGRGSAAGTGR